MLYTQCPLSIQNLSLILVKLKKKFSFLLTYLLFHKLFPKQHLQFDCHQSMLNQKNYLIGVFLTVFKFFLFLSVKKYFFSKIYYLKVKKLLEINFTITVLTDPSNILTFKYLCLSRYINSV